MKLIRTITRPAEKETFSPAMQLLLVKISTILLLAGFGAEIHTVFQLIIGGAAK